jgi:hypothetical protein
MSRARNELNADALDVVVGIIECLDLKLTSVAGSGIDMANAQSAAENSPNCLLDVLCRNIRFVSLRRWFSQNPRANHP